MFRKFKLRLKFITITTVSMMFGFIGLSYYIYTSNGYRDAQTFLQRNELIASTFIPHEITQFRVRQLEEEKRKKEFDAKVNAVEALLARYNSPMRGFGNIIVQKADECGGDYKILVGIAGNESGLGRIPYKLYNPYGYLDGKQYSGWEEALSFISCAISRRFIAPCNRDLRCIIRTYAGPADDKEQWIRNVTWFMNQV